MKPSKKIQKKLQRRRVNYDNTPAKEKLIPLGLKMHRPGSQNRNK